MRKSRSKQGSRRKEEFRVMRVVSKEGDWDHERTRLFQRKSLIETDEFYGKGRVEFQKSMVKKEELYQKKSCLKETFAKEELNKGRLWLKKEYIKTIVMKEWLKGKTCI